MKKIIALLLLSLCCLCNGFGKQRIMEKKEYTLLDYDRAYLVDISVDTTLRLNQLPEYKHKKTARYTTPHKVHCDFKLLYLWKNNHVVRALVKDLKTVPHGSINIKNIQNKYFEATYFTDGNEKYHCRYNNNIIHHSGYKFPTLPHAYYDGPYLFKFNNTTYTLNLDYIDVLKCTPPKPGLKKQSIYFSNNPRSYNRDISSNKEDMNILKDFIWSCLFIERKNVLIPEALPSKYADFKGFVYNKACCNGSDIHVKPLKVGNKTMYLVENILNMLDWRSEYRYKQRLLYIPHVLYLPYSDNIKFISLDKNGNLANTDHYFRYKINAINGQPFGQFMAGYTDNFKAKIHVSKRREPDNQQDIIPVIHDLTIDPPTTTFTPPPPSGESIIYDVVQVQPNFPGGMNALYEYINTHRQYPASAREAGIQGRVIIGFVVGKDGSLSDVQVLRSLDPACDEEAVRLVKSMPAWSPGKQGDRVVRVRMMLPVVFKNDNN